MERRSFMETLGGAAVFAGGVVAAIREWTPFEDRSETVVRDKPRAVVDEGLPSGTYTREGHPGAYATYSQIDSIGDFEVTPSVVGTREMSTMTRLVGHDDVTVSSTEFQPVVSPFTYGFLESSPSKIPVLKVICVLDSTRCETLDVRIGTEALGVDEPLMRFGTGVGDNTNWQYDEVYLNEVEEGTAARKPRTISEGSYQVWARVSGGGVRKREGTIRADSTLSIEWEVI